MIKTWFEKYNRIGKEKTYKFFRYFLSNFVSDKESHTSQFVYKFNLKFIRDPSK